MGLVLLYVCYSLISVRVVLNILCNLDRGRLPLRLDLDFGGVASVCGWSVSGPTRSVAFQRLVSQPYQKAFQIR